MCFDLSVLFSCCPHGRKKSVIWCKGATSCPQKKKRGLGFVNVVCYPAGAPHGRKKSVIWCTGATSCPVKAKRRLKFVCIFQSVPHMDVRVHVNLQTGRAALSKRREGWGLHVSFNQCPTWTYACTLIYKRNGLPCQSEERV